MIGREGHLGDSAPATPWAPWLLSVLRVALAQADDAECLDGGHDEGCDSCAWERVLAPVPRPLVAAAYRGADSDGRLVAPQGTAADRAIGVPRGAPCELDTYVHAGTDEDGTFYFEAECNAGPGGDCGWRVDIDADPRHPSVNSTGFRQLEDWHREHATQARGPA